MSVNKNEVLVQLRQRENVYVMYSKCTRMPFVLCDSETYDDEVFIFFDEADGAQESEQFNESGNPAQMVKIEKKNFLPKCWQSRRQLPLSGLRPGSTGSL